MKSEFMQKQTELRASQIPVILDEFLMSPDAFAVDPEHKKYMD